MNLFNFFGFHPVFSSSFCNATSKLYLVLLTFCLPHKYYKN